MTKPVTIPNTFATATTAIPLSQLDSDFSTVATALNDANTYSNYAADTGVANAYVVTLSGVSTTYSAGLRIQFKAGAANTGASTLNVNGGGTKNITFQDASALSSGTIAANAIVDVMYDGTQFLLMNDPAGATGGDVVGPSSATDNAIVRFDGATGKLVQNSVVTIADSTGDMSGVGQLNATTVDATNIEVTNIKAKDGTAAGSIADSTGVVTLGSSVLTTTDINGGTIDGTAIGANSASTGAFTTLSASSTVTLSGGTANGVLYLNGSKVATSGSALNYNGTSLGVGSSSYGVAGTINVAVGIPGTTTGGIQLWSTTTDAHSIGWGDGTTGTDQYRGYIEYAHSDDTMRFAVVATEQMRLTSTGLGIGTSSPSAKLHVDSGATGLMSILNSTNANGGYIIGYSSSTAVWDLGTAKQALNVGGASDFGINVRSGFLSLGTGNTERLRLDSSGNLGLGVTPSAWSGYGGVIELKGVGFVGSANSNMQIGANWYYNGTNLIYKTSSYATFYRQNAGAHEWATAPSGTAGNTITFTQALTLDANRNLLLNGTTAGASAVGTFAIFNGTAPTGSVTNGCILYAEDVSSSSELKVRDEAGNVTTLSPHNFSLIPEGPSEDMAWSYYSEKGGKRINVDMLKLARMVEKLTGEKLVYES